mmetsp:Transcript_68468/g.107682  ORF Transcript_68468/g.107682 Transcript_68468/m.107682 type:complete len:274 (+) Transcript_68468:701-1522(+)
MLPRWQHAPLLATAEIPQSAAAVEAAGDATVGREPTAAVGPCPSRPPQALQGCRTSQARRTVDHHFTCITTAQQTWLGFTGHGQRVEAALMLRDDLMEFLGCLRVPDSEQSVQAAAHRAAVRFQRLDRRDQAVTMCRTHRAVQAQGRGLRPAQATRLPRLQGSKVQRPVAQAQCHRWPRPAAGPAGAAHRALPAAVVTDQHGGAEAIFRSTPEVCPAQPELQSLPQGQVFAATPAFKAAAHVAGNAAGSHSGPEPSLRVGNGFSPGGAGHCQR